MTAQPLGNGLTQNFNYNAWNTQGGRLASMVTGSLQNTSYQYDAVGNITNITNTVASETNTYVYDNLDRLRSWTLNGTTETYDFDSATGNLLTKAGVGYTYDVSHKHAVASLSNGNTYSYDANGNMTARHITSGLDMGDYALTYDAENRLTQVDKTVSGVTTTVALFTYDGDGKRVISTADGATTRFASAGFEVKNPGASQEVSKYYFAGAQRIALRTNGTLSYMTGDHLGSTSLTTDANGNLISELRYKPWGETRYVNGSTQTDYKYTGQREEASLGLYFYNARWYDPALGRFAQADTIIQGQYNSQFFDRYAYTLNNPIRYTDPSGHCTGSPEDSDNPDYECWKKIEKIQNTYGFTFLQPNSEFWTLDNLAILVETLEAIKATVGEIAFAKAIALITAVSIEYLGDYDGQWDDQTNTLKFDPKAFDSTEKFRDIIVHEFVHILMDILPEEGAEFLKKFQEKTGWTQNKKDGTYNNPHTGPTIYASVKAGYPEEDFAESFRVAMLPGYGSGSDTIPLSGDRLSFVGEFLDTLRSISYYQPGLRLGIR